MVPSFRQWERCWRVFTFAMTLLKHASRVRLDRYAARIRSLNAEYPQSWAIIGMAEIHMRSENLERIRRECAKRKTAGTLDDFKPDAPWDIVFREAALDVEFWTKEVDKKVLGLVTNLTSASSMMDLGFGTIEEIEPSYQGKLHQRLGGGRAGRRMISSGSERL